MFSHTHYHPFFRPAALALALLLLLLRISRSSADQHLLLDTTKESMLDWTRYPYGPDSPTPGWVEESFTNFEKNINWRSYVVCDVGYQNVNNWLWTPFITRHDAQRMYIEVKFSLRNCDLFPGTALQCKETFSLLYYEFDAATREPPPWEPESYKQIDVIAADEGRFTNANEVIINTETRSIEVTKKGVYFAFRDQGACLSLLAVKVYYLKCPEITQSLAHYPETATGPQVTSIQRVSGTCVRHSVSTSAEEPYNLCQADGTWNFASGQCQCVPGYEPAPGGLNRTCSPCPVGQYKSVNGSSQCEICPAHSQALLTGATQCECNSGFFRSSRDPVSMSCTRPPSAPQRLRYRLLDASTVVLSWLPPKDEGARSDTLYSVTCVECPSRLDYHPGKTAIDKTEVRISGLYVGTTYTFQVRAENGVSSAAPSNANNYNEIRVMSESLSGSGGQGGDATPTNRKRSMVSGVRVAQARPHIVKLTWNPPPSDLLLEIEAYEVKYFARSNPANTSSVITKRDSAEIKGLQPSTEYSFQVRAQTSRGWSDFSPLLSRRTPSESDPVYLGDGDGAAASGDSSVGWTVGVVSAILLVLVLVLVVAVVVRRRLTAGTEKKEILDSGCSINYSGMDKTFLHSETQPIVHTHTGTLGTPLYNPFSPHKTYIDPHTYEDPNVAVKHFAKEIDAKYITIEAIIGGGEFGEVCRGRLSVPDRQDMLVAIKTLKNGSSDKEKIDFLTEASIMGQFEHPNVIFLQGVVTKVNPIMILTEYMENGSLDTFLRANDGKFQVMQLVGMMRGIAYGMQYLSEMNYVHRDLAARNVLVNSQLVCKIADFGLSREILDGNADGAYTTRGGKIPVRWTAPEAIAFRKFTSSSDVWSFGIVMWEVMSYGERPYWTWSNQEVIKHIEKGYRLPAPMDCPEAIHQLMLDAWQKERAHRPNFLSIVKTLDKLICCPETLKKIASSPSHVNPFSQDAPDYAALGSVSEWLASIKMSRYAAAFAAAGVVSLEQVAKLTLQQLTADLGVTLVGHQKKIMNSIQAMRAQLSVNMSEGFLV